MPRAKILEMSWITVIYEKYFEFNATVAHKDKTLPRIQNHIPESKKIPQNPKQVPESKTHPRIWIMESVLEFW